MRNNMNREMDPHFEANNANYAKIPPYGIRKYDTPKPPQHIGTMPSVGLPQVGGNYCAMIPRAMADCSTEFDPPLDS